jgi:hypothetical protein
MKGTALKARCSQENKTGWKYAGWMLLTQHREQGQPLSENIISHKVS